MCDNQTILRVQNVSKLYGMNKAEAARMMKEGATKDEVYQKTGVTVALWDVNFEVKKGEIFVIIGLSGSGKSTIIRCLNLLNRPTTGDILYQDQNIAEFNKQQLLDFRRHKISMVFQSFGLMSHRDVLSNVAFGLEVRGVSKEERAAKGRKMTEMVGLKGLENQPVSSLSGGMRQRVGIARALASDPEILLMDEPFSALDPLVRRDMQFELLSIQRKLEKTVIFITHDIDEAFKLGDRVAIMRDGKIIQIDTPEDMSAHPADEYVQRFIDSADKTKVMSVRHVMTQPACLVRTKETPAHALNEMRDNKIPSAYVVDEKLHFKGLITLEAAIEARNAGGRLADHLITDIATAGPDMMVSDILPILAESRYPLAVLNEDQELLGIVNRAAVISCLI